MQTIALPHWKSWQNWQVMRLRQNPLHVLRQNCEVDDHGQYSAERLVRALGSVHPMELYRISRDNPAKLPGWRRYVYPIYTTYNGKCRKDALPMKF